jgi:hypothetical protein
MKNVLLRCSLVLTTSLLAGADAAKLNDVEKRFGPPALWVAKPSTAPQIDGKLDDACWKEVKPVTLGYCVGTWWDPPTQKTEARVLADERAIYFAVRCFESEPERILPSGATRQGAIVNGDTVEFFLDPGHGSRRHEYFHLIVTPNETIYRARGLEPDRWKGASISAKVGKFDAGWTVEASVPLADLQIKAGAIPKTWGLNICRQRPELGYEMPKAAKDAGNKRFDPPMWKLDRAKDYRLPEHTAWAPTMAEFSGWPFYADSRPFHIAERFGHAVLEVGTQEVTPPARLFEVIVKVDFDDGGAGPFQGGAIFDENFRGPGKSLGFPEGKNQIRLAQPLQDLDDVTLIFTYKRTVTKLPYEPHLSVTGDAPDGKWCGPERYEIFLPPEMADARMKMLDEYHRGKYQGGIFELYDTHADMVRWKPCGRVRPGPGGWAMVEGYFSEPSCGQIRWPMGEWVIVRIRPALFRRQPGPQQGQRLVPLSQNYPNGLLFRANPKDNVRIDDVIIFRGADVEPPQRVGGLQARRAGNEIALSWDRTRDNTLTAFYRIYAGKNLLAETPQLTARVKAAAGNAPLTVVAVDLYGNASSPSEPAKE